MTKTTLHPDQDYTKLYRIPKAKHASAQERNWQSLLDLTKREPAIDGAVEFDDELVRLVDDCARRAISE